METDGIETISTLEEFINRANKYCTNIVSESPRLLEALLPIEQVRPGIGANLTAVIHGYPTVQIEYIEEEAIAKVAAWWYS